MSEAALTDDAERGATTSVGMIVALSALAMTFAALLLAYAIVRAQASAWPPPGEAPLPALWGWRMAATIASLAGSAGMSTAARRSRTGMASRPGVLVAATAGVAFLAFQGGALRALGQRGIAPGDGIGASVVYALCLFHAIHVLAALAALGLLARAPTARRVAAVAWFWHLVTAAWIAVFVGVFVL